MVAVHCPQGGGPWCTDGKDTFSFTLQLIALQKVEGSGKAEQLGQVHSYAHAGPNQFDHKGGNITGHNEGEGRVPSQGLWLYWMSETMPNSSKSNHLIMCTPPIPVTTHTSKP